MLLKEALDELGISYSTLKRYVKKGLIRRSKYEMPGKRGKYNYWEDDIYAMVGKRLPREHWVAIYCRVNGKTKEADAKMIEQKRILYAWCAKRGITIDKVYEERARSTEYNKYKRPVLHELINDVLNKRLDAIVIETKDRITRIGFEMWEELFKYHGVEPLIVNKLIVDPFYQAEQAEDLALILEQAKIDRLGNISKSS